MMQNEDRIDFSADVNFKDDSPLRTVERIKNILRSCNIQTTEIWLDSSVPYCHSLRVSVDGTTFGTNGKGITREFALASGYGELMERLQLGFVGNDETQKDGSFSFNDVQSVNIPADALLARNRKWYEMLAAGLHMTTGENLTPEQILYQYADADNLISSTPYYCITSSTVEHFPASIRKDVYTSNGCAAGNSPEEAIVQAISEIVERHNQLHLFYENITAPDVPEDVIEKCKIAYAIITYLRSKGFKIVIKDCSLGKKFPVVGVYIIDKKTGKYHTHFGAYPIFEIALERALTESFQARDISQIAIFDSFKFEKTASFDINTLLQEITKGVSEKCTSFFVGEKKYDFNHDVGFSGKNNKELYLECIDHFKGMGFDILVRDCSCLGFPTYQVIIPGYSEIYYNRLCPKFNDRRYSAYARKVLKAPTEATPDEMLGMLMHLSQISKISKNISRRHGFAACAILALDLTTQEDGDMMTASLAYVNYALGRYRETIENVNALLKSPNVRQQDFLICIKKYLSLTLHQYSPQQIREILEYFHNEDVIAKLYNYIEKDQNPFEGFTLRCSGTCHESCILYTSCWQQKIQELFRLITSKTKELSFEDSIQKLTALSL